MNLLVCRRGARARVLAWTKRNGAQGTSIRRSKGAWFVSSTGKGERGGRSEMLHAKDRGHPKVP